MSRRRGEGDLMIMFSDFDKQIYCIFLIFFVIFIFRIDIPVHNCVRRTWPSAHTHTHTQTKKKKKKKKKKTGLTLHGELSERKIFAL